MILISHRGNINGKIPETENHPSYIQEALSRGYQVEIDVWYHYGWWLGHDKPQYRWEKDIFEAGLWCHCKNIEALNMFRANRQYPHNCEYFWHQQDDYTLTSGGYIWTYPGKPLGNFFNSIAVLPETILNWDISKAIGICSDNIEKYKQLE
jgi:hypothetical protein